MRDMMTMAAVVGWVVIATMFVIAMWADRADTRMRVAAAAVR